VKHPYILQGMLMLQNVCLGSSTGPKFRLSATRDQRRIQAHRSKVRYVLPAASHTVLIPRTRLNTLAPLSDS
jgi:hypothetical protein